MENIQKNQPKSKITRISYIFFSKILNFCLTDRNIYLINNKTNNFLENYILKEKSFQKVGIFSILGRIRIRIHI